MEFDEGAGRKAVVHGVRIFSPEMTRIKDKEVSHYGSFTDVRLGTEESLQQRPVVVTVAKDTVIVLVISGIVSVTV